MAAVSLADLFTTNRVPSGWLPLLLLCCYWPFGLLLVLLRLCIGLNAFFAASVLPKTSIIRCYILRVLCGILGIVVQEDDTKYKNPSCQVLVSNHISMLDHLAVNIVLPCTAPLVWDLPKILAWGFGFQDFGAREGRERLIDNTRKYTQACETPVLALPEGATTNGQVGLLKFSTWPFALGHPVHMIVMQARRPFFIDIAVSVLGGRWWSDIFWFFFVPCTVFTIRYIGEARSGDTDEITTQRAQLAMARALSLHPTTYTCADKVEYLKRVLHSQQQCQQETGSPDHMAVMVQQVHDVLPHISLTDIRRDLAITHNVSVTISNLLEEAQSSSTSHPSEFHQDFNTSVPSFGRTAQDRMLSFQDRKKRLIDNARRRYMHKNNIVC